MSNTTVRPVGRSPVRLYAYTGKIPVSVRSFGSRQVPLVEYHLENLAASKGEVFDESVDNKSVASVEDHMNALMRYKVRDLKYDDDLLQMCIRYAFKAFGGSHSLNPLHSEDELKRAVKLDKSSGAPLFTTKGDAWDHDFKVFSKYLRSDIRFRPYPCTGYSRVQHGETKPKTRLVWGYPQAMTILEAQFAYPLSQSLLNIMTPYCFGLHKADLMARAQSIANANIRVGLDFSGFDATVPKLLIYKAFDILKTWFRPMTEEELLSWKRIVWYFINTPILMPDGYVYQKHTGVPSGSFFTQMIDSIVNFIVVEYIHRKSVCQFTRLDNILVLGDDSLCTWSKWPQLADLQSYASELGFRLNVKKSLVTRFGHGFDFLGHHWEAGLPHRDLRELAKRAIFPERRSGIDDRNVRSQTRVLSMAGDAVEGQYLLSLFSRGKNWGGSTVAALNGAYRVAPEGIETGWSRGQHSVLHYPVPASGRDYLLQSLLL